MDKLFGVWLQEELDKRDLKQADLARMSGLKRATINRYVNQIRTTPDPDALKAIARALGYKPEDVFRIIGILPPEPDFDPLLEKANYQLAHMPAILRNLFLRSIDNEYTRWENERQSEPQAQPKPKPGTGPLKDPGKA